MLVSETESTASSRGAALLRDRLRRGATTGLGVVPVPRDQPAPLSFAQERMWVLDRLRPGGADYQVPVVLRLRGPVDRRGMAEALTRVVARHEILRTRYPADGDDRPVQVTDAPAPVPLAFDDMSALPPERARVYAEDAVAADVAFPFDLENGPVLRARLLRTGTREYVLALVVHHIAIDGWSVGLLVEDLAAQYTGEAEAPAADRIQYADYAHWQRSAAFENRVAAGIEHWRARLTGVPALELPTDRRRPVVWEPDGATVGFEIPADLAARVADTGRERGATPFMVYLAVLGALLARYSGQRDFAIGTPVAGRTRAEVEPVIGAFINMLAMRTDLSGDPSLADLVDRARATALDAFDHQEVPFERVVNELVTERDLARNPLYQVGFVMGGDKPVRFEAGGVTGQEEAILSTAAKLDLNWALDQRADGSLAGTVTFPHALFDRATVERMAAHFVRFMEGAVTDPALPVSRVGLLEDEELQSLVRRPRREKPSTPTLPERFAERARATPEAVALTVDGADITYEELDGRANQIAQRLSRMGVGREDLVGVHLTRGPELLPALLGVLKAGAGYVPLDPAHPAERIATVAADAGIRTILTEEALADSLDQDRYHHVLALDTEYERSHLVAMPRIPPEHTAHPDDRAYVIYTSGSTGRPKGVEVTHANVVRLITATEEDYRFDAQDVWPLFHSFAFDVSVWEIWGALLHGGRLVSVPHEVTRSPLDLLDLLVREGVTVLNQTPTAFRGLVELAGQGVPEMDRLGLHTVILAGEALDVESLRPWWQRFGDRIRIVNMYGITETTVHTTVRTVTQADLDGVRSPIGGPMADLGLYVLDAALNPVPVGVPGEIHVGGPGAARGYLDRPALTAERFVPDPYGPPGARMYRSGDKARVLADGEIEFLGRFDDQVKIRGFRIETGEVQSCLEGAPGVAAAVVVVDGRESGEPRLVGYVQPVDGYGASPSAVRAHAAHELPGYMVPAVVITVDRIPLTANGKVNKAALPKPDHARPDQDTVYVAPRTPEENAVAEIWSRILGVDDIGVHDNFFALGGDSIRAVRLSGALRAAGYEYSVHELFLRQSVAELTAGGGSGQAVPEIVGTAPLTLLSDSDRERLPLGVSDAYPTSMVQAGMLYEMTADPDQNLYHNVTSYLVRDGFDHRALEEAVATVTARHEVLRTSFDLTSYGEPVQLVHEHAEARVGWTDVSGLDDEEEQLRRVREFGDRERERPFTLAEPPLVRFHAHRFDDERWYLTLTECHAVLDGWSHNSTLTELLDCYRQIRNGSVPDRSPTGGVRYADFVAQERVSRDDPEQRRFWAERVGSADRLALPDIWAAPDDPGQDEVTVPYADIADTLRDLAFSAGASLKSVLLSAHLSVWRAVHGNSRFLTGLVCNGRPEVEGGDTVRGMYLNTVPFHSPDHSGSWRDLVARVFAEEVELWPYRRYPLPLVQRESGSADRLIDVVFNYLDFHVLDRRFVDTSAGRDASPNEFALNVTTEPGALVLTARSSRIAPERLRYLATLYRAALEAMAADPEESPARCPVPAYEEPRTTPAGSPVAASVADTAQDHPGTIAVQAASGGTDYATLWARSRSWARYLRSTGVRRGDLVAVCLPRDTELVAALLGVLAAGAGYVPLDPAHPDERIEWIIGDTAARAVITSPEDADRFTHLPCPAVVPAHVPDQPDAEPVRVSAQDTAYVIHTSGSTGRPKGVVVSHGALAALVHSMGRRPGIGAGDVLAAVTTPSFDIAALELFGPLVHGGRILLADEEQARNPEALADLLEEGGATALQATPTQWRSLLDSGRALPPALRALCGGERLGSGLASRIAAATGELWDLYGPTETTVWSAVTAHDGAGTPTLWEPVGGDEVLVLSDDLAPVPEGAVGQVCVAGAGLADGYAGRPALTAERFVPDPRPVTAGERLYLTGDLGRRHADGRVEILGRTDDQVKVRGFRVETGEVEETLAGHPGVRAAVVHPLPGPDGEPRLVAYLTAEDGEVARSGLRELAVRTLPDYMVPSLFVFLDHFPTTANGKVDRGALPEPEAPRSGTEFVQPRGRIEEALAAEWERVLAVDRVGADDDFFALGGHSLLMMRIIAGLRADPGIELGTRDFVEHRTVAGIAAHAVGVRQRSPLVWFDRSGTADPLFCVHPGGGSAHWYRDLAEELAGNRPLAAFEWTGTDDGEPESVPDIAQRYLAALRRDRPEGPYLLLGWCGGGAIAWEMARTLRAEGERVRLLLLDPVGVSDEGYLSMPGELGLLTRGEEICRLLDTQRPGEEEESLRRELLRILRQVVEDDGGNPVTEADLGPAWLPRLSAWRQLLQARMEYQFTADTADLDLVLGDELVAERHVAIEGQRYDDYLRHWSDRVVGDVRVHRVPGDHLGVLRPPHVSDLARVLDGVITSTPADREAVSA